MDAGITTMAGVKVIDIILRRHKLGIKVKVKIAPEIEEFFKQWGGGVQEAPRFGRLWKHKSNDKLLVWSFDANLQRDEEASYSIVHTGGPLRTDVGTVNISFLRLVGAVEGTSFIYDAVVSKQELEKLATRIRKAAESFYTDYIQQVNMNIFVGIRELPRDGG